jgi:hypothetical protein
MDLDRNNKSERERWRDRHSQEFNNMMPKKKKTGRPDSSPQFYLLSHLHKFGTQIIQFLYRKSTSRTEDDWSELETNKVKSARLETPDMGGIFSLYCSCSQVLSLSFTTNS